MQMTPALLPRLSRSLAMTPELRRAIGMLRLSNIDLAAHLEQLAAGNRQVQVVRPLTDVIATLWPPRDMGTGPPGPATPGAGGMSEIIEATQAATTGLHDHARREVGLLLHDPQSRRIAEYFIAALEPSGWLGLSPEAIAADAGCDPAFAETVLARIQQADPTGLFARDLAECLTLQAREAGLLSPAFVTVLGNLPLLAQGRIEALAQLAGCTTDEVRRILAAIRRFDPKPGARFDPSPQPLREPDLIIRRRRRGWLIELNRSTLPGILIRDDADAAAADLQAARWLDHALARRNATLLTIGEALVARQPGYLARGPAALHPMRLTDIAHDCNLHESTISRAASGLLIQTPQGVVTLHDLCGAGFAGGGPDGPVAAGAVRHLVAQLIANEPATDPLSDAEITRRLAERGIRIARRTVAKYRSQQGIPAAGQRKARARLHHQAHPVRQPL